MSKASGDLFIVSAPSGAGKTSLTRAAVEQLNADGVPSAISVSYTTRAPRPGEQDGVHYHFVSPEAFAGMAARGEFLEHAEVFGRRYGTGREASEAQRAAGRHLILDIDWQGGRQVRSREPAAVGIYIVPPSREELERRLRARAQDTDAVIAVRMQRARDEMSHLHEYKYLIINRNFEEALSELMALIRSRGGAPVRPVEPGLIEKLLA